MTLVQKISNSIVGVDTKVTGDYTGYTSMMQMLMFFLIHAR